ncbi:cadmium resistance transporter [Lactiplantibacillus mudanjiangensis]|uniref:Membrane protein [Lactobacillus plantarum] n=1 Tax=Lactiplantibacillus mudanjiangensis TaxID=1296538 RepID=A0A660E4D9_9LACO|nr:membrane protein [Lactobacillus plantarum] [Lactiplantibacillus mudanjiangensis]VDG24078.1 membrane protein [Lactobacillus plantarum] [Lactiplantibacillus mudanjiangensis]VDG30258.1 membrane protein [Lactobacillus plantarum] [Lactiplantibacillus mudanjiangensis]VDG33821.1 membrane protein [Lactobacillus plantarum] [Lactiplantibacillus mudanjiangensis]
MNYWLLTVTFLSVNLDFFFMLIFLLKKYRVSQVMIGYLIGNLILLTASFFIGKALALFLPEWILGVLGILPIYLAFHDDDDDDGDKTSHSPMLSVLMTYLSVCAGCNLSIFLPVLVGETMVHFLMTLVFIGVLTILVVLVIKLIADVPAVSRVMTAHGEKLMKVCYVLIGLYVFWDSGLISHLIALF